jgi:nitric oxide reductase NorQ protein
LALRLKRVPGQGMGVASLKSTKAIEAPEPIARSLQDQMTPESTGSNVVSLRPRGDLFENDEIVSIESRALSYLRAGVPVHLRGPAGTGKTTLAMQIAAKLGRPAIILTGDGWLTAGNLIGRESAVKTKRVEDRFVHSVRKIESETRSIWSDDVLTQAIMGGYTLVYDEFTRSPPSANNPLLTALEERMLVLPAGATRDRYVRAHPDFRAVFTSNPEDYAGVNTPQDALVDRMITFDLANHDRETEVGIVAIRSGLAAEKAGVTVDIVRAIRASGLVTQSPSLRSAIMIAKVAAAQGLDPTSGSAAFTQLCFDVLESKAPTGAADKRAKFASSLAAAIAKAGKGAVA